MCGLSFLRHNRLYHLRLLFLVESGTEIGTANHLPLTGEPQKVVRTAEAGEECPYVSVRPSRIGIYGHTSFVGLRLVHAFSLFPLSLFHFVESGIVIGTANHLPLTSEPQKAVCTAEAEEECPYVSVRASRIGIYGHTSFVEFRLVHAFKRASKLEDVFFSHAVSAFRRCSIQSASCYAYLHFATSRRRIRWSFSFGCKGNSGICRKSKVKPPVLREKSPALRVVFFPKNLAFPNPYLDGATETKTTDATGRRIKKMSDNREADKKF